MRKRDFVLAMETAVGGGSLSLFRDGKEIDFWIGEAKISKAEDLLIQLSNLLEKNNVLKEEIKTIFVSKGPGSFTGLRIGAATAKGLEKSLMCECYGVYLFEAMLRRLPCAGIVGAALNSGRDHPWLQTFKLHNSSEIISKSLPVNITFENFIAEVERTNVSTLLLAGDLFEQTLRARAKFNKYEPKYVKVEKPLSKLIGLKGIETDFYETVFPVYYSDKV